MAPSTWRNKEVHLEALARFCSLHELEPCRLDEYDVMSYVMYLKKKLKTSGAVLNYRSSARTWTMSVRGSARHFDSYRVSVLKKGLKRTMVKSTVAKFPILATHVRHVVRVLDRIGNSAKVLKAFILIAFCTALRQSNLLLSHKSAPMGHVLLSSEVQVKKGALELEIRSTKTTAKGSSYKMVIQAGPVRKFCPVYAWLNYQRTAKRTETQLAFVSQDGSPVTTRVATSAIRLALEGSGFGDPRGFTLHSLRRGAVHQYVKAGATLGQIRTLGNWRSDAVTTYLPCRVIKEGPSTLSACLG